MATVDGVTVVMPPPEGYIVDFDNPQRNYLLANYLAAGFGMTFAFLFLVQRLYVKIVVMRSFGIDDYCCAAAWILTVAMQGMMIYGFADGLYGLHSWEMSIEKFNKYVLMANYIQAMLYLLPTMLSKLCLLIFYIKLENRHLWYQLAVWGTIVLTIGSNLGILFSIAFACRPMRMSYDITVTEGSCINREALFKATAIFAIITDILIFMIPIPMVVGLRLSLKKKLGLIGMFTIGSATVITSIVRLVLLMDNLDKPDLTWVGSLIFLWVFIESNLLIMCACLPTLKSFFQTVAPRVLGYSSRGGTKYGSNTHGVGSSYGRGGTQTISSTRPKPNREYYHGFDDGDSQEFQMETPPQQQGGGMHKGSGAAGTNGGLEVTITSGRDDGMFDDRHHERDSGDKDRDDDSAKAIIQTRTVQVSYEDRP